MTNYVNKLLFPYFNSFVIQPFHQLLEDFLAHTLLQSQF